MPRSLFPESTTPVMYPQIGNSPATPDSIAPKDLEDPKKNLLFRPHSPNDYEAGLNNPDFMNSYLFSFPNNKYIFPRWESLLKNPKKFIDKYKNRCLAQIRDFSKIKIQVLTLS